MKKHKWEKAWEDKKFSIKTLIPSMLVSKYKKKLKQGDRVLDIGCGNGRNAIYLARQGCKIDCFDVMDLKWKKELAGDLQEKINFRKSSILEYPYDVSKYQAVILTRVIQYLSRKELSFLIEKIRYGLKPNGFLLLNYNTKGGIFNKEKIDVPTFSYPLHQIKQLLHTAFKKVIATEGSKRNKYVNYSDNILTFDIYASDPHEIQRYNLRKLQYNRAGNFRNFKFSRVKKIARY